MMGGSYKRTFITQEVRSAFQNIHHSPKGADCENPVTGSKFIKGLDPIRPQLVDAQRALNARRWFAITAPPDLLPLPVGDECHACKQQDYGGPGHAKALYSCSLKTLGYDIHAMPDINTFMAGLLALTQLGEFFRDKHPEFMKRWPPEPLAGMDRNGYWSPPTWRSSLRQTLTGPACTPFGVLLPGSDTK